MEELDKIQQEKLRFLQQEKQKSKRTTWTPNDILVHKDGRYAEVILRGRKTEITGVCLIDKEDIDLIKKYKWSLSGGYARASVNNKTFRMHRYLMKFPKNKEVDHLNHKRLDNRRSNLRVCTGKENMKNNSTKQKPRIFMIK